jgi:malonyl-CoA O-methyltransferase
MTPDAGSVDRSGAPSGPADAPFRSVTVGRQFDRRADRFGPASAIVREVGRRLRDRLDEIRHDARLVLDVGCGPGAEQRWLLERFRHATWVGVDLSRAMLAKAPAGDAAFARWLPAGLRPAPRAMRIRADAERLPLADGTADCVFSNLMLHWHPAPHRVIREFARVLREAGLLLFASFGPDTLRELREACAVALPHARPMPFVDMHDLGDLMIAAGFEGPVTDAEHVHLTYGSVRQLLAEVRALGANPRDDRHPALPSGRQARALLAALESRRDADGRISLTFEITYGLGWKAAPRPAASGTTKIGVDELRRQLRRG